MRDSLKPAENRTGLAASQLLGRSGLAPAHDRRVTIGVVNAAAFLLLGMATALAGPALIERAAAMVQAWP